MEQKQRKLNKMENIQETKKKIIEELEENHITNIDEAIKFLEEKEGAEQVTPVDWKWEVRFEEGNEPYKFNDDEDLIEWCEEQRVAYFSED